MTEPRSYWLPGSGAIEPPDQAGFDAWLAGQLAAGRTERIDKLWNLVTMRRPIPSLPMPLGPSNTGLDISHWNDNDTPLSVAQFELIKAAGHKFVWIKRTQGTAFVDRHGAANFAAASIAGGLWIGTMHFLEWHQDGTDQAEHHSRTVGEAVGNFPELLDVELESGVVVTDKLLAETNLRKCLSALAIRFGRKPVIYTNRNYWEKMFITARVMDILRDYKFLVADWEGPLDQAPLGLPWVHFRQKSATYQIPGIAGNIDLDEYRGDAPPPPPANWWDAWPAGVISPARPLAPPHRVIQFYTVAGVPMTTRNVTWVMQVTERQGDLLKVFDQAGDANDWWCKGQDVTPV